MPAPDSDHFVQTRAFLTNEALPDDVDPEEYEAAIADSFEAEFDFDYETELEVIEEDDGENSYGGYDVLVTALEATSDDVAAIDDWASETCRDIGHNGLPDDE